MALKLGSLKLEEGFCNSLSNLRLSQVAAGRRWEWTRGREQGLPHLMLLASLGGCLSIMGLRGSQPEAASGSMRSINTELINN